MFAVWVFRCPHFCLPVECKETVKMRCEINSKILWRWLIISKDQLVNEGIRAREVRLIGQNGDQLGIKSRQEALEIAGRANLDLVLVAANAKPPVCRIMDYGKYRFEQQKKEKEARKNQKSLT